LKVNIVAQTVLSLHEANKNATDSGSLGGLNASPIINLSGRLSYASSTLN
jgi:hypothetical protein